MGNRAYRGEGVRIMEADRGAVAFVTGASSGIGAELARILVREGYKVVASGRDRERLSALASELERAYGRPAVRVCVADLADPDAADTLYREALAAGGRIEVLVNCAGFGRYGRFDTTEWDREEAMIGVNITALTRLTKLFLPEMLACGRGMVMNVASTAAFQPGPFMAVYYATKAYVLHLTEALAEEFRGTGVSFTALCPGPVKTGFQMTAGSSLPGSGRNPFVLDARAVAEYGYRAMVRGTTVAIPGYANRLAVLFGRFVSRSFMRRMVRRIKAKPAAG